MKIFTFIMFALLTGFTMTAQVVVVNSPSSLEGAYIWETGFGADLTSDIWTGDVAFVDDGTAAPTEGCNDLVNDLTGMIGMVDRGSCEFGLKSLNAETAGAIAIVICNNISGGVIPMGGGAVGDQVTIPVVMLSLEDCATIRAVIDNNEPVNMTIGNLQFDNDIATGVTGIHVPLTGTVPYEQIDAVNIAGGLLTPTLRVANNGLMDANNVTADVSIDFTPAAGATSNVYMETATEAIIPVDTSAFLSTAPFDYSGSEIGVYDITYTIAADQTDELAFDNEVSSSFTVSDNVFSKSQWDFENDRPAQNVGFTIAGGGPIEMLSAFNVPNALGYSIDSVQFQVSTQNETLENITIKVNIYRWEDGAGAGGVVDSSYQNDELTLVGINNVTFPAGYAEDNAWVTVPILDAVELTPGYQIPDDGGYYIVGTRYEGADLVFFGFNNTYDHTVVDQLNLFQTVADFPYLQCNTFPGQVPDLENAGGLFTDFFGTLSQAMFVGPNVTITSDEDVLSEIDAQMNLYPNPASELLTVDVTLTEATDKMVYKITDATGRLISNVQVKNVTTDKAQFNVSQLPVGQYFLTIQTDKGIRTESFNVSR